MPTLYRGRDPRIKDIIALHDKGIKTIVSLRTNPEYKKQKLCERLGMKWIQIATGVFRTPRDEQFDQFRRIIKDPKNQPCYMACEIDMDRTSVYLAAYRMVDQGWTAEQVKQEFKLHHQKRWWPEFRKYGGAVAAYAQRRELADTTGSSSNSAWAPGTQ
jgi:protein tyrosine/serine phosphatase